MKVLISTLLTLSVGSAFAATTTTSVPGNTGTSATTLESVAPKKSPLSFKYEGYVEKSQESIDANKSDLTNENDLKITYKLSDNQSVRLLGQVVNTITDHEDTKTRLGHTYLQYAHSGLFNAGSQAIDLAIRNYFPTSQGYIDGGQTYQTRIYLSTDIAVNEYITVSPYLNPRFYGGSQKFEDNVKSKQYLMVWLIETAVAFNDRFSWTTDIIRNDYRYYNNQPANGKKTKDTFYLESWVTAVLAPQTTYTDKISLDLGFYNENDGNGVSLSKNDSDLFYYTRLNVNF